VLSPVRGPLLRILYDHQLFSLQDAGGASRYHYELVRYLRTALDVKTELFLGMNGSIYPFQELSSPNTHVTSFGGKLRPGGRRYVVNEVLSNSIIPFLGRMDIYHPTLYRRMPLVRVKKVVATHHDCIHERYPQMFRYLKKVLRAKQSLYARADAIICVSEASRQDLLQFYNVDAARTRVIHHGITPLPRSPAMAKKLQEHVRRDYLLYLGARPSYKNFDGLLQAFRESGLHNSLDLLVLGGGPLTASELDLVARLNLDKAIVSIPRVSDELLAEAYAAAKLFVYPSFSEGFGFPPLEAMAAGCPVLTSRTSSIPEVCLDAPFYFDPYDQASFTRALEDAVHDEDARKRSIERGSVVASRCTWKKCGDETLALYRECL
jgi:glycosyltransferase involved in cell wall biosynthesis